MKANELRIGNWVSDQGYETIVFQIDENHINDDLMSDNFKPISLTKEWLVGFGIDINFDGSFHMIPFDFKFEMGVLVVYFHKHILTILDYVHQFQNFFFIMTGEELNLK